MKIVILLLAILAVSQATALYDTVTSAKEVADLISEGSKNCFLLLFVWKGETDKLAQATETQKLFEDYPECYWGNFDVGRSDTKNLLNLLKFENDRDNFSTGREITRNDTPLLVAIVDGKGVVASGPKP